MKAHRRAGSIPGVSQLLRLILSSVIDCLERTYPEIGRVTAEVGGVIGLCAERDPVDILLQFGSITSDGVKNLRHLWQEIRKVNLMKA